MDRDIKLITAWKDTPAQVHDSQALEAVLCSPEEGGAEIHADSAYRSAEQETRLIETGHVSQINEKGSRAHPLSDEPKTVNRTKSKIRSRVEHVFGAMTNEMGGICIRTIGRARASSDWFVEPDLQHQACGVSNSQKALELRQGYCACCKLK